MFGGFFNKPKKPLSLEGGHFHHRQYKAMEDAVIKARALGLKDYSHEMRKFVIAYLKKHAS